jgi:sugar phosphate isomerase/epimerase
MQVGASFLFNSQNMQEFKMEKNKQYRHLSLSAYAFGYGFGFVNDSRVEATGLQNMSLEDLSSMALAHNLGGVEIPVDKYFKGKEIDIFENYLKSLNDSGLRLIYAFEHFDADFLSVIAPYIKFQYGNFIRVKISNFYGGNRFKEGIYSIDIEKFKIELRRAVDILDHYKVRVLIENHQDVTLHDIFEIVDEFGQDRIGINWDTGNSFPSGETVESFLKKAIRIIGNVHLKDYRIQLSEEGYIMHRCALGDGVVDFDFLIAELFKCNPHMPYTIELGAMNGREAMISNELYWQFTKGIDLEQRKKLIDFIYSRAENNRRILTLWEQKSNPELILQTELDEVIRSINFIKKTYSKFYGNHK